MVDKYLSILFNFLLRRFKESNQNRVASASMRWQGNQASRRKGISESIISVRVMFQTQDAEAETEVRRFVDDLAQKTKEKFLEAPDWRAVEREFKEVLRPAFGSRILIHEIEVLPTSILGARVSASERHGFDTGDSEPFKPNKYLK